MLYCHLECATFIQESADGSSRDVCFSCFMFHSNVPPRPSRSRRTVLVAMCFSCRSCCDDVSISGCSMPVEMRISQAYLAAIV